MSKPLVATLALSALLLTGCGGTAASSGIEMPTVGNMPLAKAKTALTEAGIDYDVDPGPQSNPQGDWVITNVSPRGGDTVDEGTVVALTVRSEEFLAESEAQRKAMEEERAAELAAADEARRKAKKKAEKEAAAEAKAEAKAEKKAEEKRKKAEAKAKAEALKPIVYEGYGTDVIEIKKKDIGAQPARISHTGYSNFAVWTLDSNLEQTDLLVNTIGNYSGTVLFDDGFGGDGSETTTLEISADGAWKIEILPLEAMKSFDGSEKITGTGDAVFYYTGDGSIATVNYPGSSNMAIIRHGYENDLVVNEIGPYSGTVVLQGGLIEVMTEGAWSISFE